MNKLWGNYPELTEELLQVKQIIKKNIRSREKYLQEAISPMIDSGGKMLRPAFVLLAGRFGKYDPKRMRQLAAAIEMLHVATLVHDDILDDSKFRRGIETVQYRYGKEYAVYIGDFLFCQCFCMLSEYEYTMESLKKISKSISSICLGEIRQYHFRYIKDINFRNYLRIISGKTAALFAISFFAGAKEGKCSDKICNLLTKVGYHMGIAFQIIDDILDYNGDMDTLGKSVQSDLKKGYYTLPLIYALEADRENRISNILEKPVLTEEDIAEVGRLVHAYGGCKKAGQMAARYTQKAFSYIERLPENGSKKIIRETASRLLERDY